MGTIGTVWATGSWIGGPVWAENSWSIGSWVEGSVWEESAWDRWKRYSWGTRGWGENGWLEGSWADLSSTSEGIPRRKRYKNRDDIDILDILAMIARLLN